MRSVFILFFMAMSTLLFGQKKLKIDIEKTSGDTIFSTSDARLYVKPGGPRAVADYLKSSIFRIRDRYILDFEIQTGRSNNLTVPSSGTATLNLLNGNAVILSTTSEHRSRVSSLNYGCFLFALFRLTNADMKDLQSSPIKSISITSSAGSLDYDIKEKQSTTIADQVARILQSR